MRLFKWKEFVDCKASSNVNSFEKTKEVEIEKDRGELCFVAHYASLLLGGDNLLSTRDKNLNLYLITYTEMYWDGHIIY